MKNGWRLILGAALLSILAGPVPAEDPSKMKGRIIGEKCAQLGKIGECYLQWADPMVFWTEEGDTYAIDLAGSSIQRERLDEAYGLEVELYGKIVPDKQGDRVQIAQLNILKPPGAKEFFKG